MAINLDRKLPFTYYCKGRALSKMKRDVEAITFLQETVRLEPDVTLPYLGLAEILNRQGRIKESEQCYDKAHELGYRKYHDRG